MSDDNYDYDGDEDDIGEVPSEADEAGTRMPAETLVDQVRSMLAREAFHYCADCHSHCRQLILTVEALKETIRQRDEERAIVDRVWKVLGITTYADAQGQAIDEIVAGLVAVKNRSAQSCALTKG